MARMTDVRAEELASALQASGVSALQASGVSTPGRTVEADSANHPSGLQREAVKRRLVAALKDPVEGDAVGRSVTLHLASYLRRPVRCSTAASVQPIAEPWRFEADADGMRWWMEVDAALGAAFADAMIGGDGTAALPNGRRVRALAARVVTEFLKVVGQHCEVPSMSTAVFAADGTPAEGALGGGLCAVASAQYPWRIGLAAEIAEPKPTQEAPDIHRFTETLILALARIVRASAEIKRIIVRQNQDGGRGDDRPATLRLALAAGGNGALVIALDRRAATAVALAAAGSIEPQREMQSESDGHIFIAAAEAGLRAALHAAAATLPGIATHAHRIVRLEEAPLPAQTSHVAADVELSLAGRQGRCWMLVPSWMIAAAQ
jgi:hypothetical protein